MDFRIPDQQFITELKMFVKMLDNVTARTIVDHLIDYGACSIIEIHYRDDIEIPYRTLQTCQAEMLKKGMVEYRNNIYDNKRKAIYFTRKFEELLRFANEYQDTIKQFRNNQTNHNVTRNFRRTKSNRKD